MSELIIFISQNKYKQIELVNSLSLSVCYSCLRLTLSLVLCYCCHNLPPVCFFGVFLINDLSSYRPSVCVDVVIDLSGHITRLVSFREEAKSNRRPNKRPLFHLCANFRSRTTAVPPSFSLPKDPKRKKRNPRSKLHPHPCVLLSLLTEFAFR